MSLAKKTTIGIFWNFAEQFARRGVTVIITLLLARFLTPEDYGLVAMMAVFLAIATSLMDSGFRQALIRLENASITDINTAFYANLGLGLVSYSILYLSSPFIANFYDEPKLIELIRVAGLQIIINSFQVVQLAVLSRKLDFKSQLKASFPSAILSGFIAVGLACAGFGVWALIAQMTLAALFTTILLWMINKWRPNLSFSVVSLKAMYNFGYKLFLSGILDIVFQNIYVIVIAKIFTAGIAGYYFFATKIKEIILSQIVGAIQSVTYPALSTMQGNNLRLKSGYRKIISVTTFILFPIIMLLGALAKPLFMLILPEKWLPAVPFLQLICIASIMYPLHVINLNVLQVKGRSDLFFFLEIIKKIMITIVLFFSIRFGIYGILIGQILTSVLAYVPNAYFSAELIQYPISEQIKDFLPALIISGVLSLIVYFLVFFLNWHPLIELLVFGLGFCGLYILISNVFKLEAYMMGKEIFINKFLPKRAV